MTRHIGAMEIGLDFDGVIVDAAERKVQATWELFRIKIKPSQTKRALLVPQGILTEEQYRKVQKLVNTHRYGRDMVPIKGALKHIRELIKAEIPVRVITRRHGEALAASRQFLKRQGLGNLDVTGVRDKSKASAARGLYMFVDDDLERLDELINVVPCRIQFGWAYNRHEKDKSIFRVTDWAELRGRINHILNSSFYMYDHKNWRKEIARCKECHLKGTMSIFDPARHYLYDLQCSRCGSLGLDWDYGDYKQNHLVERVAARA
jgi:uncharacterized HAD superfamily protein